MTNGKVIIRIWTRASSRYIGVVYVFTDVGRLAAIRCRVLASSGYYWRLGGSAKPTLSCGSVVVVTVP